MKLRPAQRLVREYDDLLAKRAGNTERESELRKTQKNLQGQFEDISGEVARAAARFDAVHGALDAVADKRHELQERARAKYEAELLEIDAGCERTLAPIQAECTEIEQHQAKLAGALKGLQGQLAENAQRIAQHPGECVATEHAIERMERASLAQARAKVAEVAEKERTKQANTAMREQLNQAAAAKEPAVAAYLAELEAAKKAEEAAKKLPPRARISAASTLLLAMGPKHYSKKHLQAFKKPAAHSGEQ